MEARLGRLALPADQTRSELIRQAFSAESDPCTVTQIGAMGLDMTLSEDKILWSD